MRCYNARPDPDNSLVGSAEAAGHFKEALEAKEMIKVKAVSNDPEVQFDKFVNDKVDVADLGNLFGKPNTSGEKSKTLGAALLTHFLVERLEDARRGGGDKSQLQEGTDEYERRFNPLHQIGLEAERQVMGSPSPRADEVRGFSPVWKFGKEEFIFKIEPGTRTWK